MSYCRWSSDNWKSDVYCYESSAGYEIHVSFSRLTEEAPALPAFQMEHADVYLEACSKQQEWLSSAERSPIGLEVGGKSFLCFTPQEALAKLLWLRELGCHVPQFAIDCLEGE